MKSHKYRIYPNQAQKEIFATHFGHVRHVYNWALNLKQKTYQEKQISLSKRDIQNLLVVSKKQEKPWLNDVNSQSLLFSLDCLDKAYTRFFKKQNAFPCFKNKHAKQSFACPQHCRVNQKTQLLTIPKVKDIKIKLHRPLPENFKTVTISKTPSGKYYASFVIDEKLINTVKDKKVFIELDDILGLDLGITDFVITSEHQKIDNLRLLDKSLPKLAKWQKIHARQSYSKQAITTKEGHTKYKKIYSKNKEKSKLMVAKLHEKIANQRHDYLHKISHSLVSESQATYIAMENLNVKGMIKNKKLARHIANVAWYKFTTLLSYKAEWNHKKVIQIDHFAPSSKTCGVCHHKLEKLPLKVRSWVCPQCHTSHDRDVNAAKNIARFAQIQLADGLGHSLVVKSSPMSKPISVGDVAKGKHKKLFAYGSQKDAPPIVSPMPIGEI